jgi:hypothetical protein
MAAGPMPAKGWKTRLARPWIRRDPMPRRLAMWPALGPMGDQMSKAAERVGDQLKQATMKAGEKLKSTAEERGLDSEGLKEMASEVADTFRTSMTGHPEDKDESASSAPGSAGSRDRS